jgi:hypothetical protein
MLPLQAASNVLLKYRSIFLCLLPWPQCEILNIYGRKYVVHQHVCRRESELVATPPSTRPGIATVNSILLTCMTDETRAVHMPLLHTSNMWTLKYRAHKVLQRITVRRYQTPVPTRRKESPCRNSETHLFSYARGCTRLKVNKFTLASCSSIASLLQ